ncbi:YycH family regulatory protein [Desmospora profundinema]|uniref:Regulatory protein YycH of two-component signal transduction system YycFG n=1 Tax=Desmospora profundinema TaxID=1571184 RepID=A0ABU1IKV9_9BACL|nr:two-component system activity regulator YycH [Desmospora profundinema]MDR6225403.1 regulatory protein YycH of two-component signal transduction system YycFG [Desmospora profundinema]
MTEHLKSIALLLLIMASCVQTGLLWYSSPSYEEPLRPDYVRPFKIGNEEFEKQNLFELTAPPEILLHREGIHQQLFPENAKHQDLMEKLHFTTFGEFKPITPSAERWNELLEITDGIELRMNRETDTAVLAALFSQSPEVEGLDTFSRIWFHSVGDNGNVSVWVISDQEQEVREGTGQIIDYTDWLTALADFENSTLVSPVFTDGESQVEEGVRGVPRVFYLPEHVQRMDKRTYTLNTIDIGDMRKALFPDPSLAKRTLVRDSVYIYSDRSRTLQHNEKQETMVFSNPGSSIGRHSSTPEELSGINRFINRHGGWTSNYLLEREEKDPANETTLYDFRLFVGNHPVYWKGLKEGRPDRIRLAATEQGVASYERSLRYLITNSEQAQPAELSNKETLLKELEKRKLPLSRIHWIYPGYQAETQKGSVDLTPVWVVVDNRGEISFIP